MEHPGEESKAIVLPADPELGYTKDEAKSEASRCMQCVCDLCLTDCELMAHYRKAPYKLAADICGDSHTMPPFSNCEATRQTYSCNMCSHCSSVCPEGVDMGDLFRFSREDRWKQKKWVPGLHDYWLRELDFSGSEGFYTTSGECDYLFVPGCQLGASMPKHVLNAWNFLRERIDTGIMLGCCGAPAIWAGDLDRKASNLELIRSHWEKMGKPTIICACATRSDMLKGQLEDADITSLYTVLAESNAPTTALSFDNAAVFDPCSARNDNAVHASVRTLSEKSGCAITPLGKDAGKCCGYGGHMRLANPKLYNEITDNRASASDLPYIVYCANCLEVFRSKGKECAHILDAVFGSCGDTTPTLSEKRSNVLTLKGTLMQEIDNMDFTPSSNEWDTLLVAVTDAARANMEDKLITDSDVREAIFAAQNDKDYFEDADGLRTACLQKSVLTYWVDYHEAENGEYVVEGAYCHRMHIGEEAGS